MGVGGKGSEYKEGGNIHLRSQCHIAHGRNSYIDV